MDTISRLSAALADRYRIERELGQGGMATVYLAHDLKHDRHVALKVLKPELAAVLGAERFVVEIKTTAALQHPNILPLFDSGTADSFLYYVMPYIQGETLRSKLDRETQLGVDEAVKIAREVADALDYAHRNGVIHRDIKPENILLHDGRPMVADFGIALAVSAAAGGRMTETGLSLGTPYYMSPEQATAEKEISARSDVYSLASVLYEMLTGEPPYMGNSAQQIIMKIITETAQPVTKLRKSVPPNVADAVARALEKLPADRFPTAAAFSAALGDPNATSVRTPAISTPAAKRRRWIVAGVGAVLAAAAFGVGRLTGGADGDGQVMRVSVPLGDSAVVRAIGNRRLALSPAGDRIVFVGPDGADEALWVREVSQPTARKLPDTKGAFAPFFSPDGESIGFFTAIGGQAMLKVITLSGAVARTLVADSVAAYGGGDWGDDGNIVFTTSSRGLARVSATGGSLTVVSRPDSSKSQQEHDYPNVLPGSKKALVMLWMGSPETNRIGVVDLKSGAVTDLAPGTFALYLEPGRIVIGLADGRLMAASFDVKRGVLTSTPVQVLQGVQQETSNGTLQFAVSKSGTLLYQAVGGESSRFVWVTREGSQTPVDSSKLNSVPTFALSPSGGQIALHGAGNIWVKQISTGVITRLSFDVTAPDRPAWTPDGRSVAFLASRSGRRTAYMRRADGSDATHPATPGSTRLDEITFDPLGRFAVLRTEGSSPGTRKILIADPQKDSVPRVLLQSPFDHYAVTLSPNGKWLAVVSAEAGTPEVHVRPFPAVDSVRYVISVGGGVEPLWSRNGRELYFRNPRGDMFAAPVSTGTSFSFGVPKRLFLGTGLAIGPFYRAYDVHPDGQRFLMVNAGGADANSLALILNWRKELDRLTAAMR
ncbi:MAG: protein kinase [Gemmatimonadetes bacterium]|nr:protein kinase [Gemmatimonadota bacterium]